MEENKQKLTDKDLKAIKALKRKAISIDSSYLCRCLDLAEREIRKEINGNYDIEIGQIVFNLCKKTSYNGRVGRVVEIGDGKVRVLWIHERDGTPIKTKNGISGINHWSRIENLKIALI